jgi:2-dehydropantoate 2-reductase
MHIGIIGPGALGCLFSTRLFLAADGQDKVLLIDHRPERARQLNEQGIIYQSGGEKHQITLPVSSTPEQIGPLDALFFCVKSHDLKNSLTFASPLFTPATLLIFMQNGISHLEYEHSEGLQGIPVFATSSEGATLLNPGHIRHGGSGHTHLGFLSPRNKTDNDRLQGLTSLLQKGGIAASFSGDIRSRLWAKLFVNVGINALTAIYNWTNGQILVSSDARNTLKKLVREAEKIARATGITIKEDPVAAALTVCKRTADNISSMLQDVRNCRPTEIEAINGAVSRLGKELNIATPVNDSIVSQIRTIEAGYNAH